MDDRIEQADQTPAVVSSALGRREMLKRTGFVVGAAAFWATPLVQTVGMRPAAASLLADFCPAGQGRITQLILGYTGRGCGWKFPFDAAGQDGCTGVQHPDPLPNTAYVEIRVGNCGGGGDIAWEGVMAVGGDTVDVPGFAASGGPNPACTSMTVYALDSDGDGIGPEGSALVSVSIHTSCSEELNINEEYGPLKIVGGDWV